MLIRGRGDAPDPSIPVDYAELLAAREASDGWIAVAEDNSLSVSLFIGRDPDSTVAVARLITPGSRAVTYFVRYFQRLGESAEVIDGSMHLRFALGGKKETVDPSSFAAGTVVPPVRLKPDTRTVWKVTFIVPAGAVAEELVVDAPWSTRQPPVRYRFVRPE